MHDTIDILVIGAGPSGLTVAAEAARAGASVLVIEKRSVSPVARAGTLLPRPLELFDARGIADRFIRRTAEYNPYPFQTSHIWAGMHPVDWTKRDSRFGYTLFLSQHETEVILQEWARECGADILHEHELVGLVDGLTGVTATIRSAGGEEHLVRARYAVGADGGRSRTRDLLGIDFVGHDATFTGLVATADLEFPWPGALRVEHNERGWISSFRFGPGQTRFTIVHAATRSMAQSVPVTAEEVEASVADVFGEPVTIDRLVSATRYGDAKRVASRLVDGHVALLGEAARVHYPASGVGMNFCIQDAFNLGWKLGAIVSGQAGESLLKSYATERRPIIDDLLSSVDAQVGVQFTFTPEGLAFLKYFSNQFITEPAVAAKLWDELNGLQTPYPATGREDEDSTGVAVGLPAPDFELQRRDGSTVRLYELLRESPFVVLDLGGGTPISTGEVDGLPATVVQAHPIRLPDVLVGSTALIVRPDTYVAWSSTRPVEPGEVRAELHRALHLQSVDVGIPLPNVR